MKKHWKRKRIERSNRQENNNWPYKEECWKNYNRTSKEIKKCQEVMKNLGMQNTAEGIQGTGTIIKEAQQQPRRPRSKSMRQQPDLSEARNNLRGKTRERSLRDRPVKAPPPPTRSIGSRQNSKSKDRKRKFPGSSTNGNTKEGTTTTSANRTGKIRPRTRCRH